MHQWGYVVLVVSTFALQQEGQRFSLQHLKTTSVDLSMLFCCTKSQSKCSKVVNAVKFLPDNELTAVLEGGIKPGLMMEKHFYSFSCLVLLMFWSEFLSVSILGSRPDQ